MGMAVSPGQHKQGKVGGWENSSFFWVPSWANPGSILPLMVPTVCGVSSAITAILMQVLSGP